jgi:hypothetical protein
MTRTYSGNAPSARSEAVNNQEFFSVSNSHEIAKPLSKGSMRHTNSSFNSSQIEETTIDDLSLLDCSKYLRIREITIYSDDNISGIMLKYRLPTGQYIQSNHCVNILKDGDEKKRDDLHEWKSMSLDPQESINHISWGYSNSGLARFAISTNSARKLVVEGRNADENMKIIDINLKDDNKILAGMKTKVQDKIMDISIYVSELRKAKLEDLISEGKSTIMSEPMVTTTKMKRKKIKKKLSKK